ncbi:hypothetical protein MH117_09580 [Paenibacillus sp. ACRRX]|uniref:hypothetical protein n=1 Tax=Paenibacillus sp. ACRRX TaxID=2918206 RepID=UPI001EF72612|nr:hypothetical protein [Paenibacillus sp. ACRRX]MCG7407673.1 hypothetical protein [Paenibacillus sp. ACRRX]
MARKQIWMNPPLEKLAEECGKAKGRDGKFSTRLGDIVERYDLIMRLTPAPELSDNELMIMGEVILGSALTTVSLKYMHESILDAASGTADERQALHGKATSWSIAERIALIEVIEATGN